MTAKTMNAKVWDHFRSVLLGRKTRGSPDTVVKWNVFGVFVIFVFSVTIVDIFAHADANANANANASVFCVDVISRVVCDALRKRRNGRDFMRSESKSET